MGKIKGENGLCLGFLDDLVAEIRLTQKGEGRTVAIESIGREVVPTLSTRALYFSKIIFPISIFSNLSLSKFESIRILVLLKGKT